MRRMEFDCRHRFAGGFALDVAFAADRRVTALFGPSGSGKTSVLAMIAGFLRPREGRIALDGRTLVDTRANVWVPIERREIGFVFQDHCLFPHLSVEANLRYGPRHGRRRRSRPAIEFSKVVEALELDRILERYPARLSGGERQRVALGRALMSGPELMLLDEPLASLDDALKMRVLDYVDRVVENWNLPTIYVSHSRAEVRRLANWVISLDNGRLMRQGTPDDVLRPDAKPLDS